MKNALSSIFLIGMLFVIRPVYASNEGRLDSLKSRLEVVSGREKLSTLLELCKVSRLLAPQTSIEIGQQALALSENLGYQREKFTALHCLGAAYSQDSQYENALNYLLKAHRFAETKGYIQELAHVSYSLAATYLSLDIKEKCVAYAEKALKIYCELKDKRGEAKTLGLLGVYYERIDDYDRSLEIQKKSLKIAKEIGYQDLISSLQNNIGNIYLMRSDTIKGMQYYFQATSSRKNKATSYNDAIYAMNMGALLLEKREFEKAMKHFKKGKEVADKLNSSRLREMYYANLSDYHYYKKDYKKALELYAESVAINDSLIDERLNSRISDLEVKHAIENKNKENELLRKENRIQQLEINRQYVLGVLVLCILLLIIWLLVARYRSKLKDNELLFLKNKVVSQHQRELVDAMQKLQESEDNLRKANATKDKMFSLIAHDLRGSIGNISNGLRMLLNDEELELTEEDKAEFLETLFNSADNSYELLENLLLWARNQSHTIVAHRESLELKSIIDSTVNLLIELARIKAIDLIVYADKDVYVFADRNMLQTVVRNLISNAIKFTHRGGKVEIRTELMPDVVKVSVIDDGIGMRKEQIANIYKGKTTEGTDREKGTGLGLMLCRDFLAFNEGELSVKSELGKGSTFSFTIPRESLTSKSFSEILGEEAFISRSNG